MCKINIINILLDNMRVNNYTKLLIVLDRLSYYKDYCIVSKKLCNLLKIDKRNLIRLLNQLVSDNVIVLYYQDNKRFFRFIDLEEENKKIELFDYNWLEDEE